MASAGLIIKGICILVWCLKGKAVQENAFTALNQIRSSMEKGLIRLLESKVVKIAKLPKKNDVTGIRLEDLQGYTVPLISHDYAAKTPVMWNTLYESMRMPLRNIMVVADPKNTETILPH